MGTIDFRRNMWGHALHADTFREEKADGWLTRILDKIKNRRRYSVMVHSGFYPQIGDKIVYKAATREVTAEIFQVVSCHDPKDMFTLKILLND